MANPLSSLRSCDERTMKHVNKGLEDALANIQRRIAKCKNPASAVEQQKLYRDIQAVYAQFGSMTTKEFKKLCLDTAKVASSAAGESATEDLVKFDQKRLARYYSYVSPTNSKNLAAVFTDKMAETTIQQLRTSLIDVNRQAAIEGWSMKDIRKKIGEEWRDLAKEDVQFTDKSGRTWDNKQYLEMLTRTTAQRVYTDAYADRLAESGFKLARITNLGGEADCPACKAWQDVIIVIAGKGGKYPTLEDARAAGVFHPNCMCSLEYVDEDIDADDIQRQKDAGKIDWNDAEAMQKRTDNIKIDALQADGMTHAEAVDELTRQKVDDAIRAGAGIDGRNIADELTHDQLAQIRENGIPTIQLARKGEESGWNHGTAGGVLRVDRTQKTESLLTALTDGETTQLSNREETQNFEPNTSGIDKLFKELETARAKAGDAHDEIKKTITATDAILNDLNAVANDYAGLVDLTKQTTDAKTANSSLHDAEKKIAKADANFNDLVSRISNLETPANDEEQKSFNKSISDISGEINNKRAEIVSLTADAKNLQREVEDARKDADAQISAWKTQTITDAQTLLADVGKDLNNAKKFFNRARCDIGKLTKLVGNSL